HNTPDISSLVGGGGGGGGAYGSAINQSGSGGGGGGGVIKISAADVVISGALTANGGAGGQIVACGDGGGGGGGAGGAIWIRGGAVSITGTVSATGGSGGPKCGGRPSGSGGAGGTGRIRVDSATTLSGTTTPAYYKGDATGMGAGASCTNFYTDDDKDGYGTGTPVCQCFQTPGKTALQAGDCDDTKASVNPVAKEVCDGANNDCKNGTDDGCDDDGDGYCDGGLMITSAATCAKSKKPAPGALLPGDDCDDANAAMGPGNTEVCDGADNNCNTTVDEGCDDDNDNFCEAGMTLVGTPSTCTAGGGDCNDTDGLIKPGGNEVCSTTYDDNCNGQTNEQGAAGCTNYYLDNDGDGYGQASYQCWCAPQGNYKATKAGDCDDTSATVYPGAANETCDGKDNNCNLTIDEGCDDDKDSYCDGGLMITSAATCAKSKKPAPGALLPGDDCDDNAKDIYPGVAELCDAVDNNCDGKTDELCDADGDGYCDKKKPIVGNPPVCSKGGGDCDDTTSAVSPGVQETCDSKDNNCNGQTDEAGATGCKNYYFDGDMDGYGTPSSYLCLCAPGGKFNSTNTTDCDDTCPTCAPGKPELCDDKDNSCGSGVDEGCNADGDKYCTSAKVTIGKPAVCTMGGGDCNDANASMFPGALESCNNADENCNGVTDENASDACTNYPNAVGQCTAGSCQLKCLVGFYNLNGSTIDGCECNGSDIYEPNDTCGAAYVVNTNLSDAVGAAGNIETVYARLVDNPDVDWYRVYAYDTSDGGYAVCDKFNMRVRFLNNPGGNLRFDVFRGACPSGNSFPALGKTASHTTNNPSYGPDPNSEYVNSGNTVCCQRTDFNWFTNFKSASGGEPSRQWSEYGECPCATGDTFDQSNTGWSTGGNPYCMTFNTNGVCFPRGYYFTQCRDDSANFYVRVHKVSGSPICAPYSLEFSNGVYGQPGTGNGKQGF
ncbi:MAG: putative metal-binding motif-containing protein, partial [Deltaproteobacteria bacterium]|nr:putative metal-binding motif-containing protein [Deltaproteobacteria bacterium]